MKPIIFLDIDGVLNDHSFDEGAQSCSIKRECVRAFNRVLRETGAEVVLSSAWRYVVSRGDMTLAGFEYMLGTHGVAGLRIVGATSPDETCVYCHTMRDEPNLHPVTKQPTCPACNKQVDRGHQILDWDNCAGAWRPWVALDDLDLPSLAAHRLVRTDGQVGLTEADADRVIELLAAPAVQGDGR